jgi:hypothetical protein
VFIFEAGGWFRGSDLAGCGTICMFVRVFGAWLRPGTEVREGGSRVVCWCEGIFSSAERGRLGVEILPGIGGTELE